MSRNIHANFLSALAMFLLATVACAQQPLGVIAVDWNYDTPEGPRRDPELIYKTLKAAFADTLKKKLNVPDPAAVADLDMMQDGHNLRFVIMPKGAVQPTQDEILAAVKESYLDVVKNFFNDYHNRELREMRSAAEEEVQSSRKNLLNAQQRLKELRNQLRTVTRRVDVFPDTLRAAVTRVEDERDKLALDSESMGVRRKAIEQTIAGISDKAEQQIKTDRIVVELEKLIVNRETELKRTQTLAANNNVAQADVEAAESRVGEARVRLWERQEIVTRTAGGDLLADLNKELAMLSINLVESEARLKRLQQAVDDYSKVVDLIDELESAQTARQSAQQAQAEAESRMAERLRSLRQFQPPSINFHGRQ